jgi:phospholipid-binding lipoprotein MlaA
MASAQLQGCATARHPDPIEGWNRKVFAFNETVDAHVLKPVAIAYRDYVPDPVRTGFTNFVGNLKDAWSTVNLFLQGRMKDGALGVMRVSINSTLGLGGLIDIASPMQLYRPNEDFGQTLGVWGVKPGAYIVWPFLGASTLRDSVGIPGDFYFSASTLGNNPESTNGLLLLQLVNLRANLLDSGNLVNDVALDKYAFIRNAYLQRRQNLIYEGDPPEEDQPEDEPTDAAPSSPLPPPSGE